MRLHSLTRLARVNCLNPLKACCIIFSILGASVLSGCEHSELTKVQFVPPPAVKVKHENTAALRPHYRHKLSKIGVRVSKVGDLVQLDYPSYYVFRVNSANLTNNAASVLRAMHDYINTYNVVNISVGVFTAKNHKSDAQLQALTSRRAQEVASRIYSGDKHVAFIDAVGYGVHSPIALNNTYHGRKMNQRIEIRFRIESPSIGLI